MQDVEKPGIEIGGQFVAAGTRGRVDIDIARLPAQAALSLPVEAVVGSAFTRPNNDQQAPRVWLSSAIHGDEINGIEIINQVLARLDPASMNGVVLAVPIVNVYGFTFQSRYMPDRRDLNRCFPGSKHGSLAARLARLFLDEIVAHATHGIDLHTGSNNRTNLPQTRTDLDHTETAALARAFRAPVMIHGEAPKGSLRAAVAADGKPILVYEAGEAMRFNQEAIELGVAGVLRVLAHLGVIEEVEKAPDQPAATSRNQTLEVRRRSWIRASASGIFGRTVQLGDRVNKGDTLGDIHEPLGAIRRMVRAPRAGVVIGFTNNPLAYQGDALIHLAHIAGPERQRKN